METPTLHTPALHHNIATLSENCDNLCKIRPKFLRPDSWDHNRFSKSIIFFERQMYGSEIEGTIEEIEFGFVACSCRARDPVMPSCVGER